jgi:hypothetical protein
MDSAVEIAHEAPRGLLNQAIEALLSDGSLLQRLSVAQDHIGEMERYSSEIPDEIVELKSIVDDLEDLLLDSPDAPLSPARELALAERLLTLYVQGSAGALIF